MIKKIAALTILLSNTSAFAEKETNYLADIEALTSKDVHLKEKRKRKKAYQELSKFEIKESAKTERPFLVVIKKNSIMTKLSDSSLIKTKKNIVAWVRFTNVEVPFLVVLDKKDQTPKYQVNLHSVARIEDDLNIDVLPQKFSSTTVVTNSPKLEKTKTSTTISLKLETINYANLTKDVVGVDKSITQQGIHLSQKFEVNFPIKPSIELNYQRADSGEVKVSSANFGASAHYRVVSWGNFEIFTSATILKDLAYSFQIADTKLTLSDLGYGLDLYSTIQMGSINGKPGHLNFGGGIGGHHITIKKGTQSESMTSKSFDLTTAHLYLGYGIDYEI